MELAKQLCKLINSTPANFKLLYDEKQPIRAKIETIAREIYGADGVTFSPDAEKAMSALESDGMDKLPVCMAKTQYSLSDDPDKLGRPSGFTIHVRELRLSAGAGFIVALTGNILVMPGLPQRPAANQIDIDENGNTVGLF